MSDPVLEVKNLSTFFKTPTGIFRAVDGISFKIPRGGTFALVGESGCGKTMTALSIIQLVSGMGGYIEGGRILLNGKDIIPLSEREKRGIRGNKISMIFQEPMTSLNPVFTIGDQIMEAITLHQGKTKKEGYKTAIEMFGKVGLADPERIFHEYPHKLSGGMRQRVMIAIALICKPDLLIADEPTTALDVTIQKQILDLIKRLKGFLGTAVLFITHNLALVYRNADTVGVMYAGKIVELASTKDLFRNPKHPYTIKLMSSIPGAEKRGKPLDTITGTVPPANEYSEGCRFASRCPSEMEDCSTMYPALRENENGHWVSCHLNDPEFIGKKRKGAINLRPDFPVRLAGPQFNSDVVLEVRNLKTHFQVRKGFWGRESGHVKAVDGVSFVVRKGSTLALVGESGSGKTTVGKSIVRLIRPKEGEILFKGKDFAKLTNAEMKPYRSNIQMIFQDPYSFLNPRRMIKDIMEEGLKALKPNMGREARFEKIAQMLSQVGLNPEMMNRYPHEFSGGQRQRIGIARALSVDPEFIVCDEAVSSLDVSVQAQILNLLKSIQKDIGISLLFITHDLSVVEYIADEVAIMYAGKIVETGSVEEIFTRPKHAYTRKLFDAMPMIDEAWAQE